MTTLRVDFNDVTADGRLKAYCGGLDQADLQPGTFVQAFDPLEDIELDGLIEEVQGDVVYLQVDWSQLDDDHNYFHDSNDSLLIVTPDHAHIESVFFAHRDGALSLSA